MPPRLPRRICKCLPLCFAPNTIRHTTRTLLLPTAARLPEQFTIAQRPAIRDHPSRCSRRHFNISSTTLDARPSSGHVIDDFYAELLAQPLPASAATERPIGAPPPTPQSEAAVPSDPADQTPAQRAAIVFGSRLLPPNVRKANLEEAQARGEGEWLAGHWIPPRPPEPDNCCMSGCVNCVWDVFREDLESWVAARTVARTEDRKRRAAKAGTQLAQGIEGDDDGVGSTADLNSLGLGDGEDGVDGLMSEIPVGIREFMRTEKRLQEQHRQQARSGSG